jgi:hypothetical protein
MREQAQALSALTVFPKVESIGVEVERGQVRVFLK